METAPETREMALRFQNCPLVLELWSPRPTSLAHRSRSGTLCIKMAAQADITKFASRNPEEAKKAVIRAVANTNRGKDTTREQRKQILESILQLEDMNTTRNPVQSPLLSGHWSLLYTAPIDEKTSDKYAGTQEGPFLARIKPFAFGSIKQTRSSQVIDVECGVAKNIADFTFFGINGTLTIKGKATPSAVPGKETVRLDVIFEEFVVKLGSWVSPIVPLNWINPQGWIDTTFLDKDLRIGHGDKGSVFVSARVKSNEF